MDPEVPVTVKIPRNGVWQVPDPELDGRPVRDHCRDGRPDDIVLGFGWRGRQFHQGHMVLDNRRHLRDVDERVPEDPGHGVVDLEDQFFAAPGCGGEVIVCRAHAEEAGLVHGRDGRHRHIDLHVIRNQLRDLVEVTGDMVVEPHLHRVAVGGGNKPRVILDGVGKIRGKDGPRRRVTGKERIHLQTAGRSRTCPVGKRGKERRRLCDAHPVHDRIPVFYVFHGSGRACQPFPVHLPD